MFSCIRIELKARTTFDERSQVRSRYAAFMTGTKSCKPCDRPPNSFDKQWFFFLPGRRTSLSYASKNVKFEWPVISQVKSFYVDGEHMSMYVPLILLKPYLPVKVSSACIMSICIV
jgi:hypothetical protein